MGIIWTLIIGLLAGFVAKFLMPGKDPGGFFITMALTYTGGLQGTGDTRSPLFITLASQIAVPLGLCAIIEAVRPLTAPDIWLAIVLGHVTRCVLTVLRFRQGRWRQIKVEIESAHA